MKNHWIGKGILCVLGVIALGLGVGWVVMTLWNWLIPAIFTGAVAINYVQALGLLLLCKILFGGFGGRGCHGGCGHKGGYWRSRWKNKWETMSEEERAKVKNWCGKWDEPETKQ